MTKALHPRVVGPDGKPVRIRRTQAEIASARLTASANAELDAMTAGLEAVLARASPDAIRRAEKTLAVWRWRAARY